MPGRTAASSFRRLYGPLLITTINAGQEREREGERSALLKGLRRGALDNLRDEMRFTEFADPF